MHGQSPVTISNYHWGHVMGRGKGGEEAAWRGWGHGERGGERETYASNKGEGVSDRMKSALPVTPSKARSHRIAALHLEPV
eukprot:1158780-Pelagomonas_calceolata.AAC.18